MTPISLLAGLSLLLRESPGLFPHRCLSHQQEEGRGALCFMVHLPGPFVVSLFLLGDRAHVLRLRAPWGKTKAALARGHHQAGAGAQGRTRSHRFERFRVVWGVRFEDPGLFFIC